MVASGLPVLGLSYIRQICAGRAWAMRGYDSWVALSLAIALALPCLVYRYLPMVDLPQHEAVVSMMLHLRDRNFGFDAYYHWAPLRTLYLVPYGLAAALAQVLPLHRAINGVAFIATLTYPMGVLLYARAMKRPAYVGLMALPFVYNQSFFWGFINFNLSIGLAFITISVLVGVWSRRRAVVVALLSCLVALTHVYGLMLLGAYFCLWLLTSERREASRRVAALMPAASLFALWVVLLTKARGFAEFEWSSLAGRWSKLPESIAGGWSGHSEMISLSLSLAALVVFFRHSVPLSISQWKQLGIHQRVVWAFIAINLFLYFSMPELPQAATKSSFRHAQIAIMAVPLTLVGDTTSVVANWTRLGLWGLGVWTLAVSWFHFSRFDAEARSFDVILNAVPQRAKLAQLTYERRGKVAHVPVYMHFAAYAQAKQGGLLAVSFPARFWNMPIAQHVSFATPPIPKGLEWKPKLFGKERLERYFDYVVLRTSRNQPPELPKPFPYELQLKNGPWWLLRKVESNHD